MTKPAAKHLRTFLIVASVGVAIGLSTFAWQQRRPNPTHKYSARSSGEAKNWQAALRVKLSEKLKIADLLEIERDLALKPKVIATNRVSGITIQTVRINIDERLQSHIFLSIPNDRSTPVPAVVCLFGHGSNGTQVFSAKSEFSGLGLELTARGYATISVSLSGCRPSLSRTRAGERLWKLIRCLDYLESLDFVDKSKIGCAGLSMGGEMAMWLGAMDSRVKATVCAGFLTTMDHLLDFEKQHCPCWKIDGLERLVDFSDIFALHAPRALLCQSGLKEPNDQFPVTPARSAMLEVNKIYKDLGASGQEALQVHDGGHVVHLESALKFFEKHLPVAK
ncbi:MAG: acyl-CoA thioester hydrolase/BAAT C-terminal domain-containing protein [Planctomycetota bacterium]|nr:acyl-CoA thioester hydrolase/BAAT C-terminal domain-containing protein [Planctomycetota bacterium]